MVGFVRRANTEEKLKILSTDAQYDLACACGTSKETHRKKGSDGKWIYPVTLPNGGKSVLFKTLMSNHCSNDCKYCPLRQASDIRRCSLTVEETAKVFLDYLHRKKVFGLFLSSGCMASPDATMDKINAVAKILRKKYGYRGYIHLKVLPGASTAAIEEAVSLSSAVSLNIETPGEKHMAKLSDKKNFINDIIEPIKLISRLTGPGGRYQRVKQTTQFIVGAAGEKDSEIIKYMAGLYERLHLQRVYFSAYQQGLGKAELAAEQAKAKTADVFMREHRLYQVDFLLRKYKFDASEIIFDKTGSLSLQTDPKELWARSHAESFPVDVNRAGYFRLLRVPGIGAVTAKRILHRRKHGRLRSIEDIGKVTSRLKKADEYLVF